MRANETLLLANADSWKRPARWERAMATTTTAVHCDPEILGGKPVFVGTRVPFQTLVDYIAAGHTLDQFLDHFPTVSREQALGALEVAGEHFRAPPTSR